MTSVYNKSWWQSKTIWGTLITSGSLLANNFGIPVPGEVSTGLLDAVPAATGLAGTVLAVYGRAKADRPIGR